MEKHENGIFTVNCESIINKQDGMIVENPSVIIDTNTGTVLKIGDVSWVKDYYSKLCSIFSKANCILFTFDRYQGSLDADSICTIMNYLMNSLGPNRISKLLEMPMSDLLKEVARLQSIGW